LPYGVGCAWVRDVSDQAKLQAEVETLRYAYRCGARYFDTSEAYGDSELVVGEFVRTIPRHTLFLATKSRLPYLNPDEAVVHLRSNLERSLRRLHTDHLDLYQLHDADARYLATGVPPEVIHFLQEAREKGWIRYFGMAVRAHRFLGQAVHHGQYAAILTYSDYTPINQSATELIRMASARRVGVINGSPLNNRWLNGTDPRMREDDEAESRHKAVAFYDFCRAGGISVLAAALQFPMLNANIDMNLTGPGSAEQWAQSMEALRMPVPPSFWTEWSEVYNDKNK